MRVLALLWFPLLVLPVFAQPQPATTTYEKLISAYRADLTNYRLQGRALAKTAAYRRIQRSGDRAGLDQLRAQRNKPVDKADYTKRFQAGAADCAGTDGAVPFLLWICEDGNPTSTRQQAAETLIQHHLQSPQLGAFIDLCSRRQLLSQERTREVIDILILESPHDLVKAHAYLARAAMPRAEPQSESSRRARLADLDHVTALAPGSRIAMRVAAPAFERDHLQVGMPAPDIAGTDMSGVAFNLSDYNGKVVFLDFWGDW